MKENIISIEFLEVAVSPNATEVECKINGGLKMVLRWIFLERIIRFIQVVILVYHTHTADKVDSVMHST